jgi:GT2 family glycosyltransferase
MSCSIVIPVHDGVDLTKRCLDILLAQDLGDAEIVVVDDASGDGTAEEVAGYEGIRVVRNESNQGFAGSCNAGAACATGEQLVFLNNDTRPTDGWLDALLAYAREHPRAGIVGAKLLWPNGSVQHAGVGITRTKDVRHLYAGFPSDHPAVDRSRPFQVVTAACMLVRREVFEALGGFDPAFVNGYEDVDLCLRAGELGQEVHYCHECVVYHLESSTRGRDPHTDAANSSLYHRRWDDRVRPDDVTHYVEDGLVDLTYHYDAVRLSVDPLLGATTNGGAGELSTLLALRESQVFALQRENAQLARSVNGSAPAPGGARHATVERDAPAASVIVPVDHPDVLPLLVAALARQDVALDTFDVWVMHPESSVRQELDAGDLALSQIAHGPHGGRAAGLNRGIREARGNVILLLGDDIVPPPGFVSAHLAAHAADPDENVVAIGGGVFPPRLRDTAFRRWLDESGEQFGVSFTSGRTPPPGWFWCGNTSLKRDFLLSGDMFDERLSLAAWDDYELGLRLEERGMVTRYLPEALGTHEHPVTVGERRMVMHDAGVSAARFDDIYPPGHRWHKGLDSRVPLPLLEARAQWSRLRYRLDRDERDAHDYFRRTLRCAVPRGYRAEVRRVQAGAPTRAAHARS